MKTPARATIFFFLALAVLIFGGIMFFFSKEPASIAQEAKQEDPVLFPVTVAFDGLVFPEMAQKNETVAHFLQRSNLQLAANDAVFPEQEATLSPNTHLLIRSEKHFTVKKREGTVSGMSTLDTIGDALAEKGIFLSENDLVQPSPEKALKDNAVITLVRVDIREETVKKPIPFETETKEDETLSWRKRIIEQKGEQGTREIRTRTVSHDGKIIKKTILETRVAKEPVPEIVTQGTKVEVGKKHTGLGSWYRFTGTLSAANPWLPIGSHVRVTNEANGKSVIVRINDRGPFGKNRIIDLDAVAFEKIASLGAGIINVKMEEITN